MSFKTFKRMQVLTMSLLCITLIILSTCAYKLAFIDTNPTCSCPQEFVGPPAPIYVPVPQSEVKKSNDKQEYLKPPKQQGKVFSWWDAKEQLEYKDIYTIIKHVLSTCPEEIKDKQGFIALLIETIAIESSFGSINKQKRGPALGVVQMEPATYNYMHKTFLKKRDDLRKWAQSFRNKKLDDIQNLRMNIQYGIAISTILYIYRNGHTQDLTTVEDRYLVYKKLYNTYMGKSTWKTYNKKRKLYVGEYYASK